MYSRTKTNRRAGMARLAGMARKEVRSEKYRRRGYADNTALEKQIAKS
jgi:hypothetical protein